MKLKLIFLISLTISAFKTVDSIADSQLILSRAFNVLAINGLSYEQGIIEQDRQLSLRNGKNRLVIVYEEVFDSETDDNFDIVKSDPFLLEVYLQKDQTYRQRIVKPASVSAARQFAKNPLFDIVTYNGQNDQKTSFVLTPLASDNEAFLLNQSRLPPNATLDLSSSKYPSPDTDLKTPPVSQTGQSMASKMLDYWWLQATPEEREKFLQSVTKNP